ncbi:hypothetical protein Gogos_020097 [Gossypium gossypioides]|uniref:Uncharacterized protein n=1 Tax=Gossypium gossypioides TaxID=34282 RepID=A0A7J9D1C6_GOSGO|nr:hypothetical protein [Gossypium gossypioides]
MRGECTSPTARKLNEWRAECTSPTARKLDELRAECIGPTTRRLNELRAECTSPTARKLNELRVECTSPTARKLNELRAECTSPTARSLNEASDALEKAQNHSQSDSMADDGGGEAINRPMKVSKGSRQLSQLENLDKKPHISSVGGCLTSRSSSDEEETGMVLTDQFVGEVAANWSFSV